MVHKNQLWRYTGNNVPRWNSKGASDRKAEVDPSETNTDPAEMPGAGRYLVTKVTLTGHWSRISRTRPNGNTPIMDSREALGPACYGQ